MKMLLSLEEPAVFFYIVDMQRNWRLQLKVFHFY